MQDEEKKAARREKRKERFNSNATVKMVKREKDRWVNTVTEITDAVDASNIADEFKDTLSADLSGLNERKANTLKTILRSALSFLTFFCVLCVVYRFVGPAIVSGDSMNPTYQNGKIVFVNKTKAAKAGDVVLLYGPDGEILIKRVIACGGTTIKAENGEVYVNGAAVEEPYIQGRTDDFAEIYVGGEDYFVMGDNRENSLDSRSFGVVSENDILGVVIGGK